MNAKKILITGGGGFLGSHLSERLLNEGNEIICLDNFFTGTKQNILHLMSNPRFELLRHDVTLPLFIEVDEIYNLACPASPIHYQHDPVQTTKTCVHGAINMLGLAKRTGAKIMQASTSEVYGDPEIHPQVESYWGRVNPIGIRSCYDEGKRCAETLFLDYHRQHNLDIKIARIFNTYGPRMHANDEMVDAFIRLMATDSDFIGPVNLGNPGEFTIRELAEKTLAMVGSKSALINKPLPEDDPRQRQPDISLAKEKLGWEPVIKLDEGLSKTIEYFKSVL